MGETNDSLLYVSIYSKRFTDVLVFLNQTKNRSLCVWSAMKKKPLHTKELAHGKSTENGQANWISAVATLINTDIVASGEFHIDKVF